MKLSEQDVRCVVPELSSDAEGITPGAPPPSWEGGRGIFRALRHRNFRLFVAGQVISLTGTFMQTVAQSWLVYRLTRSELLLGATWFCTQIPVFILGPIGGLVADRYSRHRIVVITQVLAMMQALTLAVLAISGHIQVWHILVLATTLGVINAFDMPGRQSLLVQMTSKEDLLNAIALNSAIFNAARVGGPSLAGIVVAAVGEGLCFLANGLSFVAVIASLLAMRLTPVEVPKAPSPLEHLKEGFRYAARTPAIRTLLTLIACSALAGMPAMVLMPFFAGEIFHRGSQGLGFLLGAMGIGAVAGTLVLARRSRISGLQNVIFYGALTLGLGFVVLALSPWFYAALAVMPVIGFSVVRQNASANTLIQTLIPDAYRGRIMALYSMMVVGIGPFGSLAAGALAGWFGPRTTVLAGGLLAIASAAIFRVQARTALSDI
ncbi:MAG: MFS transporter [bacterium]